MPDVASFSSIIGAQRNGEGFGRIGSGLLSRLDKFLFEFCLLIIPCELGGVLHIVGGAWRMSFLPKAAQDFTRIFRQTEVVVFRVVPIQGWATCLTLCLFGQI